MPSNEFCPICNNPIDDERTCLFLHTYQGVMMHGSGLVVDDKFYCGTCTENGIKMMLEGKKALSDTADY